MHHSQMQSNMGIKNGLNNMEDKILKQYAKLMVHNGTREARKNSQKFNIPDHLINLYKRSGATDNQITYLNNKWANAYTKADKKLRGLN